jgi:spectinomycin phosphotransferase
MREPPRLAHPAIAAALHAHYGLSVDALTFLPIGYDSDSAVYRVESAGAAYFLKLRTGSGFSVPSLAVPHHLHSRGLPHILAPLPTRDRALWAGLEDYALSLYPFVDSRTAADAGLSDLHWRALGATLKQIHDDPLTPDLLRIVRAESFTPSRRSVITDLEPALTRQAPTDPVQREMAAFWQSRQDDIRTVVDRADALARRLRQSATPRVLCHADLHTWNVLLDTAGRLWIADWDETILAPKERDLMFVMGGIGRDLVRPRETACFLQGYGDTAVDPLALTYYRYAWAVQEFGAYAEQVFLRPDLGEASQRDGLRSFEAMFEPGNIVSIAFESDSVGR